jgi:hypothetical protein
MIIQETALPAQFDDPMSYQAAAVRRIEALAGVDDMNDVKILQYYSLYCIFEATNAKTNKFIEASEEFAQSGIPGWKITQGWAEANVDPCNGWFGVDCVDDKVIHLNLYDNDLTGNFPPEVILLAADGFFATGAGSLALIDLFNNTLLSNNDDNSWM